MTIPSPAPGDARQGPPILHDLIGRSLLAAAVATALVATSIAIDLPGRGPSAVVDEMAAHVQVNSESDFVIGMIPHHQEAVGVARVVLERGERTEVRALAAEVIAEQAAEIAELEAWRAAWYPTATAPAYVPMMQPLDGLDADAVDRTFASDMIHHHAMAIGMAEAVLALDGVRPEVVDLARDVIRVQTEEIATLRGWIASWGTAPHPTAGDH
ncbi:MAG: DUF305 domain-containing protein [Trueperaceae bacterium]